MKIVLTTGEISFAGTDNKYTSKVWLDWVGSDNAPIKSVDLYNYLQRNEQQKIGDVLSPEGRVVITSYTVIRPMILSFCNMIQKSTDTPPRIKSLYIDLDEDSPVIKLSGLYGFGGFKGRGTVDYLRSGVDYETLVSDYSYKVMSPNVVKPKPDEMKKRKVIL